MDELIETVSKKAGIPKESAHKAVHAVFDFLEQKLPAGMGDKLKGFIDGHADSAKGVVGGLAEKFGGLLGGKKEG